MEKYFVITSIEGEPSVDEYTKEELVEWLNSTGANPRFMERIENNDMNYWGYDRLIIKGEIVTPNVKEVVKEFDI